MYAWFCLGFLASQFLSYYSSDYVDVNPKANVALLMIHGWPALWSTWSNQIQDFEVGHALSYGIVGLEQMMRSFLRMITTL
jgi:pimeloyl-ACP methyl ester carboxylesterase